MTASLRPTLVALFVTFHFVCIGIYLLPFPPRMDEKTLAMPDVRDEVNRAVRLLAQLGLVSDAQAEGRAQVLNAVRRYEGVHRPLRQLARLYLEPTGSVQTWNMFGGTPPRRPRVVQVEIQPRNASDFQLYLDGRWGTLGDQTFNFRHRKAQERLSVDGRRRERVEYARYWAQRWNQRHPEAPAQAVRLSFLELTTPPARDLQHGKPSPDPRVLLPFTVRL